MGEQKVNKTLVGNSGSNAALGNVAQAMISSLNIAKSVLGQTPAPTNGGAANSSGNGGKK